LFGRGAEWPRVEASNLIMRIDVFSLTGRKVRCYRKSCPTQDEPGGKGDSNTR
jgi:hypothetical protein